MSSPPAEQTTSTLSQTDVVIQGVKAMILGGHLSAGSRLPAEKDLAAELGVSRGSLREGVRALAILGVLETRQGDGTYVTALDASLLMTPVGFLAELQAPADAGHLLSLRRVLESESAARAATRVSDEEIEELESILAHVDALLDSDPDVNIDTFDLDAFIEADARFHHTIARVSGNPPLAALIESLTSRTVRARLWRAITERGTIRATQAEHRAILAEIARREPDRARIRMSVHLLGVEDFAVEHPID